MKQLIALLLFLITVCASIITMINGWGLEVQSWPWVIGGSIFTLIVGSISALLQEQK